MQKGSLVRIKRSADMKLIGTFGIVMMELQHGHIMIKRFVDGRRDTYHQSRLELIV